MQNLLIGSVFRVASESHHLQSPQTSIQFHLYLAFDDGAGKKDEFTVDPSCIESNHMFGVVHSNEVFAQGNGVSGGTFCSPASFSEEKRM